MEDTAAIVRTTACETLIHMVESGQPYMDQTTMIDLAELVMATGDATATATPRVECPAVFCAGACCSVGGRAGALENGVDGRGRGGAAS